MATVLFAWELGAGLGHIGRLRPLAEALVTRGHQVYFAMRDLAHAQEVFAGTGVECLQSPFKIGPARSPVAVPRSFPHILHNVGFACAGELAGLVSAWSTLLALLRPALVVLDHSPSALVALRAHPARKAIVGTGFFIPQDEFPLRDLRPWMPPVPAQLVADEGRVLDVINSVLADLRQPPLSRVSRLYAEVDEQVLLTFPELDHYGARPHQRYWGTWDSTWGAAPQWPAGHGPRIFAYLKPFQALPELLAQLRARRLPTLVYSPGVPAAARDEFEGPTLRFVDRPLDLRQVRESCELAVLNATHGVAAELLLGGVPALHFPLMLEQLLLARKFEESRTGSVADCQRPELVSSAMDDILGSQELRQGAQEFAQRYAFLDSRQQAQRLCERLLRLLEDESRVAAIPVHRAGRPALSSPTRVAVLGLYSSGSTATATILHRLGVTLGDELFRDFYEPRRLAEQLRAWWREPELIEAAPAAERVRVLRSWLFEVANDGATCVAAKHPLLTLCGPDLLEAWGADTKFIWTRRPLAQSIASLERRGWWPGREHAIQSRLWNAAEDFFRQQDHLHIEFSEILDDPARHVDQIIEYLALQPTAAQRTEAIAAVRRCE